MPPLQSKIILQLFSGKFYFLASMSLKVQTFWDVTIPCVEWQTGTVVSNSLSSLEMSVTIYRSTQRSVASQKTWMLAKSFVCVCLFLFVLRSTQPVSNETNLRALLHFVFLRLHTLLCLASNLFLPHFIHYWRHSILNKLDIL